MDLSFHRFEADGPAIVLPPDLAVLMVGIAARQAASPTALFQARLLSTGAAESRFAPASGAFNAAMASLLKHGANTLEGEMKPPFTVPL